MRPVHLPIKGINNVQDPLSLGELEDAQSVLRGNGYYVVLSDVDIDPQGNLTLREELRSVQPTPTHSLFSAHGLLLGVQNQQLCVISGATSTPIFALQSNNPLCYTVMSNDYLVFSNGVDIGVVFSGAAEQLPPVDVTTSILSTGTSIYTFNTALPPGEFVDSFSGRLYSAYKTADGCEIAHTDAYDFAHNEVDGYYPQIGEPTMLMSTDDTLWFSNGKSVIAYLGADLDQTEESTKIPFGVVKGTAVLYDGDRMLPDGFAGKVIVATTTNGIVLLGNGGKYTNLSKGSVALPQADAGFAGIIEKNGYPKYVSLLQSRQGEFNKFMR